MKGLLFTYGLCYGGAVVALFRPWYGLLIYVCFAIIKPDVTWSWSVPSGNYSRIIALATLAGWLISGTGRWQFGKAWGILLAFSGFWIWGVLSVFIAASDVDKAYLFVDNIAKILLPFVVGLTLINSVGMLKQLAWVILLSQSFLAFEANLSYFQGFNVIQIVGLAGIDNNSAAISLAAGVGLGFFLGIGATKWWQKAIAFGCSLLCGHAVLLSFSRGGMLSICVSGLVAFLLVARRPRDFAFLLVAIVVGLQLAGPEVRDRFMSAFVKEEERDESAESRLDLWRDCWTVMNRHPLFGIGPNHWRLTAHEFGWTKGKAAHSTWFEVGAELGFPGVGFLLLMYGLTIWHSWQLSHSPDHAELASYSQMCIAGLAGYLVAISFVTAWGIEIGYYLVLLGAGALKVAQTATSPLAAIWVNVSADSPPSCSVDRTRRFEPVHAR